MLELLVLVVRVSLGILLSAMAGRALARCCAYPIGLEAKLARHFGTILGVVVGFDTSLTPFTAFTPFTSIEAVIVATITTVALIATGFLLLLLWQQIIFLVEWWDALVDAWFTKR